jgi:hypothetical protein
VTRNKENFFYTNLSPEKEYTMIEDTRTSEIKKFIEKSLIFFEIPPEDFHSGLRKRNIVNARMLIVKVITQLFKVPNASIGRLINKDHSSIQFYLYQRFPVWIEFPDIKLLYDGYIDFLKKNELYD